MKVLLSTNIKDEHNVLEWIDYHIKLGFSHILIWDDESIVPISFDHPNVSIYRKHAFKKEYIQSSVAFARQIRSDWMIHLDGDEYLYLGRKTIPEFVEKIPKEVNGVIFPWLMFGSNDKISSTTGKVLEEFTRCERQTHMLTKTFARVDSITEVKNAHIYNFTKPGHLVYGTDWQTPLNRNGGKFPEKRKLATKEIYCIAHFYTQSWDIFRKRRVRKRDDSDTPWTFRTIDFTLPTPPPNFSKYYNHSFFPFLKDWFLQQKLRN